MSIGEIPIVKDCRSIPALRGFHLETGPHILDIFPADLVEQAVLVVCCRIELIECCALAIFRIVITGSVVVLDEQAWPVLQGREGVTCHPMPRPGTHPIR